MRSARQTKPGGRRAKRLRRLREMILSMTNPPDPQTVLLQGFVKKSQKTPRRMKTSRPALERLLDPANPSVMLSTLERAASALGKKLKVELA
jgi:hypothetical protein